MVSTLDDTKRASIATKLASMKVVQGLLIENEQKLSPQITDQKIQERFQKMLEDDRKNLGILETVIVQYGVSSKPAENVTEMVEKLSELMSGSKLSLYEKVFQHEILKHQQTMSGLLVHKAAQKVGADVEVAIAPLNTVNFENRAHQEQLKGVLEVLGVRELTGQEADQGLWARVQDAVAALSGIAGSAITQASDSSDMKVQDVIRADHAKVSVLFAEIEGSNNPQKTREYFGQLYKDLSAHSEAEEHVVYPAVRPFYGEDNTQELYSEQAEMKEMLDKIKAMDVSSSGFKDAVKLLKESVLDHVRQEESTMLAAIGKNFSDEQSQQLSTEFKAAKSRFQKEIRLR
ncbi:MAG: hemerythrin domain-containing protein [Drouetiella hepatica Uher 2000/2452]|jgi:hemerythrin superfamily protein|uniref:Hemerythrin domain-containing protein n=1 Tax=Drouetiella hepatica Uher 2000/2452 TaxID=904376 RepID=A0A951QEM6_9CYAN|nr:hemerythrin domain-containing protein [Drouetiella hepatica Uher 2000/2452]